ncbi:TPA: MobF family relaxase [Legionella pneumophila]|uniref:MobF family relaxase n=1 Tax=Legionella pneumophila TaxID=446 RepID=UPI000776ECE5|nr:MobF family relaxase [Legionella pneumophila]HAT1800829.1 conjugative relaxase [Legionella pneumophila]HAT8574504.1 conjugative relaxase [Legionella pneumophila]HAU1256813.1 conjugative relaxase [Legionella pneumophila]HAU1559643.1 conjugative relaxase [Legionella pneumophila]HAU3815389.1 conjugative relaxase [Legionella pneumophila]
MLSVEPLKSAQGAADYYSKAFNYYSGDATAMQWLGQGSQKLKLSGVVQKEQMLALLKGRLPDGQVLQNLEGEHRPGFDMTFSAPKSVSVLVGLGVAPELVQFHDEAVQLTIRQIEKEFAETRVSRRGEISFEKTNNLLVAAFRQPSSRANDPALHTHCVTMNITFHEGKARSLSSDPSREHGVIEQIQNNAHYCGLIYRQHLANKLKETGFHLRLTGNGLFEIDGVPDEVLHEFSTRRMDILGYMDEKGWSGAKSASTATVLTRKNKEEHDINLLTEDWKQRAKDIGFDAQAFMQHRDKSQSISWLSGVKDRLLALVNKYKKDSSPSEIEAAHACVVVAIETLSQRTSIFSERMLTQEAMKHSLIYPKAVSRQSIIESIQQEIKSQTLYEARCFDRGERLLTTPWLLTLETETIARIDRNKGAVPAIAHLKAVTDFQKMRSSLLPYPMTNSQKESMRVLLTSKDRYLAIQGYAGVAKTSMLSEARIFIEAQGYKLRGITVASSAAHELQEKAGIKADVFPLVHQELKEAQTASLTKTLFIIDEASMLSSHQGHELMKQIERVGARLVLVGDRAQLPSVNAGRIFGLTQEYGIETAVMDEVVRQQNEILRQAVIATTKGFVQEALDNLDVKTLATHKERIAWIANHWLSLSASARDETLLFAPTHANREEITTFIRSGLKQEGTLKGEQFSQIILKTKMMEPIQSRFVSYYQKGDMVRFNQSFKRNKIHAGSYYTVGEISKKHRQDNVLPLIDESGNLIKFNLNNLPNYKTHTAPFERTIEVYETKSLELLVGDKVMWTRNFKANDIRNGQCATLHEIKNNSFMFITKEGRLLTLEKSHPALKHLDYSYVLTNYKVQGKDAPYGIGLMESFHRFGSTLNNFYVQISRAIHGMTLVTDNKEELVYAIRRNSNEKPASMDITSSAQLIHHERRFGAQNQLSIQSVIDKKKSLEIQEISKSMNQDDLIIEKKGPHLTKQLSKELEL